MNRPFTTGREEVREPLSAELVVDEDPSDRIARRRRRTCLREREYPSLLGRPNLERLAPVVRDDRSDLHSLPSASSRRIRSMTLAVARPAITCPFSRSHFTTKR